MKQSSSKPAVSPATQNKSKKRKVAEIEKPTPVKEEKFDEDSDEDLNAIAELATSEVKKNNVIDSSYTFESLGLHETICETCKKLNYAHPTKIQVEVLKVALKNFKKATDIEVEGKEADRMAARIEAWNTMTKQDIIGIAETGSGKTAAFVLPVLHFLLSSPVKPSPATALVLTPTRELATQIKEHFDALGSDSGLRTVLLVGGVALAGQQVEIKTKKAHVIIGTPGRVCQHLRETNGFNLHHTKFVVLDEADKMLGSQFEEELQQVIDATDQKKRTTYLFSATMTKKVEKLMKAQMKEPMLVQVAASKYATVDTLKQEYLFVPEKFKEVYLAYLLNENAGKRVMIFVSQNVTCILLTLMLKQLGFSVAPLAGHMDESSRINSLRKFKSGDKPLLIATDVASRGLDIPFIDLVILYDIPTHSKEYIHRAGRTARAGKEGRSITFVTQYDLEYFQKIEKLIGKKMDECKTEKENVLVLTDAVSQALKYAKQRVKEPSEHKGTLDDEDEVLNNAVLFLTKKRELKRSHNGEQTHPNPSKQPRRK